MRRLILFDIDGTLLLTGGAGGRAMARAFADLFGVAEAFHGIAMPGRTDAIILADALARSGLTANHDVTRRFRELYCCHLREEIKGPGAGKGVMPGVRRLLDELSTNDGLLLGLLTGNFADAARIKLEHFDLWRYFRCGAFGDEVYDRNALVPEALQQARACGAEVASAGQIVVVGDTPLDVACAHASGAVAVAVATGGYALESLAETGAEHVFENLGDVGRVLSALGIRGSGLGTRG